jgi:hypothetical protein
MVDRGELIGNSLILFTIFSIIMMLMQPIHAIFRGQSDFAIKY